MEVVGLLLLVLQEMTRDCFWDASSQLLLYRLLHQLTQPSHVGRLQTGRDLQYKEEQQAIVSKHPTHTHIHSYSHILYTH